MNAEVAEKSVVAARPSKPVEPEWKIEDHPAEIEVVIEEDDDLYGNMPFTD